MIEDTIYIDSVPVIEYKSGTDVFLYSIKNRAEENTCLVLLRRQYGIFGSNDYISFPKMMGSSVYFEVYSVRNRNVQIWRFSKGLKNFPS